MDAYALVAAEEIFFSVQLHRLAIKSTICVDFTLRSVRMRVMRTSLGLFLALTWSVEIDAALSRSFTG